MEASAIHVAAGLHRRRVAIAAPLLKLRSDQQLVAQFQAGNEDAFRVIHDRYRARLLAYVRQMLPVADLDAEDTLQDVFVRAYAGLRVADRELSLRPWLYRIAHNRCVDAVRRPVLTLAEPLELDHAAADDPVAESEQRESLKRLVIDIGRLPDQQRSALLMRELGGVAYADIAGALGVSVPAVKSLLVRARIGLAASLEARDTACAQIREELAGARERGVRASGIARRHLRDCPGCQEYKTELRTVSRQLAALAPTVGPLGLLAKLLGAGGSGGAAAGSGAAAAGGSAGAGGTILGLATSHVAALVAATVVTAGGALELQQTVAHLTAGSHHHATNAQPSNVRAANARSQDPGPVGPPRPARNVSADSTTAASKAPPAVRPPAVGNSYSSATAQATRTAEHAVGLHKPASTTSTSPTNAGTSAPQATAPTSSTKCQSGPAAGLGSTVNSVTSPGSGTTGSSNPASSTTNGPAAGSSTTGSSAGSSTAGSSGTGAAAGSGSATSGSTSASSTASCTPATNVLSGVIPAATTTPSPNKSTLGQGIPVAATGDAQPGSNGSGSAGSKNTSS